MVADRFYRVGLGEMRYLAGGFFPPHAHVVNKIDDCIRDINFSSLHRVNRATAFNSFYEKDM